MKPLSKFDKKFNLKLFRPTFTIHRLVKDRERSRIGSAFTIVELLVVIVVIGILALITSVAYSGIADRARAASLQADLKNAATILEMDKTITGTYPATKEDANGGQGLTASPGNSFDYVYTPATDTYTLTATSGTIEYYITSTNTTPTLAGGGSSPASFALAWGGGDFDYGNSIIQTSDGGYAIAGDTYSFGSGDLDAYIAKYTADGTLLWSKTWGGVDQDTANSFIQTSDGGYAIAGDTYSFGSGDLDAYIAKYTADGTLLWSKTWGGVGQDTANSFIQTSDGGYAIAGRTQSFDFYQDHAYIAKYTADGSLSWNKTWGGSDIKYDYASFLIQTDDGGYAIVGETASFGAGTSDIFIAKYTSDGTLSWDKTWGGTVDDNPGSFIQTSDGGYAIIGVTESFNADNNAFLIKYTSDGTLSWDKTWGGDNAAAAAYSIIQTSDGGYVIAGETYSEVSSSDLFLAKYDSAGNLIWSKTWILDDVEYFNSLIQTSDGGYAMAGTTPSFGAGNPAMLLIKYAADGTLSWDKTWVGTVDEYPISFIQTSDGGYAMAGTTPSFGAGLTDSLLIKFETDGTITNCISPICQNPSAAETNPAGVDFSPSATNTDPSATESNPSNTHTSPNVTETDPAAISTLIVM